MRTSNNPDLAETFKTTVPVVTTLLASLSVALMIVPLAAPSQSSKHLEFPPVTADQIVVGGALLAATFFIAASVCCVYGAASKKDGWFVAANAWWVCGLPCLLITAGGLASRQLNWALPTFAVLASGVLATGDPLNRPWLARAAAFALLFVVIAGLVI